LHEYLLSIGIDSYPDVASVENELKEITTNMRTKEIGLRVSRRLKAHTVRLSGSTVDEVKKSQSNEVEEIQKMLPDEKGLESLMGEISEYVDKVISDNKTLDLFRGKVILKEFYRKANITSKNIGYKQMCIDLARKISEADKIALKLDPIFDALLSE